MCAPASGCLPAGCNHLAQTGGNNHLSSAPRQAVVNLPLIQKHEDQPTITLKLPVGAGSAVNMF